jgi:autotransporter-associated beta strand protein
MLRQVRLTGLTLAVCSASAFGATKANNQLPLNNPASWSSGFPSASDAAIWGNTISGPNTTVLGANSLWKGMQINNPGGDVTIAADGHSLSLGSVGLLDNDKVHTVSLDMPLALTATQSWSIAGRAVLNGALSSTTTIVMNLSFSAPGATLLLAGNNDWSSISALNSNSSALGASSNGTIQVGNSNALQAPTTSFLLTNTLDLAGSNAMAQLGGSGTITNSSTQPATFTFTLYPNSYFTGSINDGSGIVNINLFIGQQHFSSKSNYTGTTTIGRGFWTLDQSSVTTNIISSQSHLVIAGGTLSQAPSASASVSQTFAGTTIAAGGSLISQGNSGSFDEKFDLAAMSRPGPGGTVVFNPATSGSGPLATGIFTSSPLTASGILGGWAVMATEADWATRDTSSPSSSIHALAPSQYAVLFAPATNTDVTSNLFAPSNASTGSVRFNTGAETLTLQGSNVIESGGILVSASGTGSAIVPSSPADSLTSGNGADLIVYQPAGGFTISAPFVDNLSQAIALTKSGAGTLTLSGMNSYSGGTFLNGGAIFIANSSALGSGNVTLFNGVKLLLADGVTLANNILIRPEATLTTMDVPAGQSATFSGALSVIGPWAADTYDASTASYHFGTSGGTLTITGQHAVSLSAATFYAGSVIFAGNGSLNCAQGPILFPISTGSSYTFLPTILRLTLQDSASFTARDVASGPALAIGGPLANHGTVVMTLRDHSSIDLGTGSADFRSTTGQIIVQLDGGTISLGSFTQSSYGGPPTLVNFNGGCLVAAADSSSFLPAFTAGTNSAITGTVQLGGASFDTQAHTITVGLPLIHSAALAAAPDGGLTKRGTGTLALTGTNTYNGPTIVMAGKLMLTQNLTTSSLLQINSGACAQLSGSSAIVSSPVFIASDTTGTWTGVLDLSNGAMLVHTAGSTDKTTTLATLNSQIASGNNGGLWNGNGITSSTVAADPTHKTLIIVDNALLGLTQFNGQSVDANSILIESTYFGDSNLDRKVDVTDLGVLATNYGQSTPNGPLAGDFNNDGHVDVTDLGLLATNYGLGTSGQPFSLSSFSIQNSAFNVPEPTTLLSLLPLATCLLRRTRPPIARKVSPVSIIRHSVIRV